METKEIDSPAWEAFCRKLQDIRPRTRLTIQRIRRDGQPIEVVSDLELREARLDRNDACNDIINFTLTQNTGETLDYAIIEPIHIRLRQKKSDRYNTIEIVAEDGTHVLSAHPGFRQDLIGDLPR